MLSIWSILNTTVSAELMFGTFLRSKRSHNIAISRLFKTAQIKIRLHVLYSLILICTVCKNNLTWFQHCKSYLFLYGLE